MQVGFNRKNLGLRKFQHSVGKILVPVLFPDGGDLVPDGVAMVKAVQLDCKSQSDNIVEVPLSEIHLYSLRRSTEIQLSV